MKNQIKTEICFKRMQLLMQLHRHTCWLIIVKKPTKEKLAIWYKDFEKLTKELTRQDQILAKC